jgi:hypothetical protein
MSALGRWTSVDPILWKQSPGQLLREGKLQAFSMAPYNYSFNNPTGLKDATVEWPTLWDVADVGFSALSIRDAWNDPSARNIGWAAADDDAAAALPLVPSTKAVRAGAEFARQIGTRGPEAIRPDPIFREGYKLAFLDTDLMLLNSDLFAKLQQFLRDIGETEFVILLTPYRNRGDLNNYCFPVDIDWETFRDEPMGGTLSTILPSFPQFITGQTRLWGMYYVMESDMYIAGYADEEVLSALQANFGIEGCNVEFAEKLGSDLGRLEKLVEKGYLPELTLRQGRRFRELAEQIRAEDHASEGG